MSKPIRELNLELGRPDAAEALRRLFPHCRLCAVPNSPYTQQQQQCTYCRLWLRPAVLRRAAGRFS